MTPPTKSVAGASEEVMGSDLRPIDLASDLPIYSSSQDRLRRGKFVQAMANALCQPRKQDSLVVALYGEWGSGKTSVLNLILEEFEKRTDSPTVISFNPWPWSGRDALFSAFFGEIARAVGKRRDIKSAKDIASKLRSIGSRFSFSNAVLGALGVGAAAVGMPGAAASFVTTAASLKQASEIANQGAAAKDAEADEEPLDQLKKSLSDTLKKLDSPLLIVLDDVDRLTSEEIRLLFQLIKANADFPNVVYLMLFDREVVERALEGVTGSVGRDYMAKIVQAGFDLPKPSPEGIKAILGDGLGKHLLFEAANRTLDPYRWERLYLKGLRLLLRTPRDAIRFVSSMSFSIGLFCNDEQIEVNVVDLIGLEALRVFEPSVYKRLPEYREELLEIHSNLSVDRRQFVVGRLRGLLDMVDKRNSKAVDEILGELFPSYQSLVKGYSSSMATESEVGRMQRICHYRFFDRYFYQMLGEREVPRSRLNRVLGVIGDRRQLVLELESLAQEGLLGQTLVELASHVDVIPIAGRQEFVTALMDVSDLVLKEEPGRSCGPPTKKVHYLVHEALRHVEPASTRSGMLLEALSTTTGLFAAVQTIAIESLGDNYHGRALLDQSSLRLAVQKCLRMIEAAASDGRLLQCRLDYYLWVWKKLSGPSDSYRYACSLASTVPGALKLVQAFSIDGASDDFGGLSVKPNLQVDINSLAKFVKLDLLRHVLEPVLVGEPSSEFADVAIEYSKEIAALRCALEAGVDSIIDYMSRFDSERLDINSASIHELCGLPGIGKAIAGRIVSARPFDSVETLLSVKGVSSGVLSAIRPMVMCRPAVSP